ncbi:MAG: hypothetical protein H7839_20365 [Magnetococcus sp. YQC-5]
MKRQWILMVTILTATMASSVLADDLNKRRDMDAGTASKMMRAEAEANRQGQALRQQPLTKPAKCGTNIGNVTVQKGAMAPREINTVVKGDVISVCK